MLDQSKEPLKHFIDAQNSIIDPSSEISYFEKAVSELQDGRKECHWMWFIFPQIRGVGRSRSSERFGLASVSHAEKYLLHPVLGSRIISCTELTLGIEDKSSEQIFGCTDSLKLRSSLTLFSHVEGSPKIFRHCLSKYFGGKYDPLTLDILCHAR